MKLRVCTLFSGYDSQCMALDRLKEMHQEFDYELVAWAEIDKFAIRAQYENNNHVVECDFRIRKLTERECFRLMGVRDEDSDKIRAAVSKSQCYKLAGNSIVVDVMVRIFDQLLFGNKNKNQQLKLF